MFTPIFLKKSQVKSHSTENKSDLNGLLIKKCYKCDNFFFALTFLPEESANAWHLKTQKKKRIFSKLHLYIHQVVKSQ